MNRAKFNFKIRSPFKIHYYLMQSFNCHFRLFKDIFRLQDKAQLVNIIG